MAYEETGIFFQFTAAMPSIAKPIEAPPIQAHDSYDLISSDCPPRNKPGKNQKEPLAFSFSNLRVFCLHVGVFQRYRSLRKQVY